MGNKNYCHVCGSHRLAVVHLEGVTYFACMNCPQGWHVEKAENIQVALTH
jgi:formate dehydrogenase maturation protein FdhE